MLLFARYRCTEAATLSEVTHTRRMETFGFLPKTSTLNASVLSQLSVFTRNMHINQSGVPISGHGEIAQQILPFKAGLNSFFSTISYSQAALIVLCVAWALGPVLKSRPGVTNAVYHGYRSWLEPTFLVQARYIISARDIISSGYHKVCIIPMLSSSFSRASSTKIRLMLFGAGTQTLRSCRTNT